MKYKILITVLLVCSFVSSGCSLLRKKPKSKIVKTEYVEGGRIIDRGRLARGGSIVIVPFTAGTQVAQTDELKRLSLLVVKSLSDIVNQDGSFTLLGAEDSGKAELVVSGHITELSSSGKLKKWFMFNNRKKFTVRGKVTEKSTGNIILQFEQSAHNTKNDATFEALASRVGSSIGEFILTVK